MSQLANLKSATSRKELAVLLGYTPASLTAIIYKTPNASKYTEFQIDKKSGGKRTIKAPVPKLKKLQSHLSHLLYQCLEEIEKIAESSQFHLVSEGAAQLQKTRHDINGAGGF